LAASGKATEVYRHLMRANPSHYAPYLAASLHNHAILLNNTDDRAGALAAIEEAIALRRRLEKTNSVRYASSLDESLQLQVQIESSHDEGQSKMRVVNDR